MPVRGERSAPIFDPSQPSSLRQYFAHLEKLFTRCAITNELEKKEYTSSYPSWNVASSWETLPEYTDASKSYTNLKDRLLDLYNQSTMRYTYSDLERLVSEQSRLHLRSLQDLSEFHLHFNTLSTHLLEIGILSKREESLMYLQAFDVSLQSQIKL